MQGICAVIHDQGWAITNEALLDEDKHLEIEGDKKIIKGVLTLKLFFIFDAEDKVSKGQKVECLFKSNTGRKEMFIGTVQSRGKQTTVIHNLVRSDKYNETLNKIKR